VSDLEDADPRVPIGDKDLFDVWDDEDHVEVKLLLLLRILAQLRTHRDEARRQEALRLALKLLAAAADLRDGVAEVRAELEAL
jgi:hypothetical protein